MDSTTQGSEQLIRLPKGNDRIELEQMAYVESNDAVINKVYAYLVYKETKLKDGAWEIKVLGNQTANSAIDPDNPVLRKKIAAAAKEGSDYCLMGFTLSPREGDPRMVENRIYFDNELKPEYLQLHLVTRNSDGSASDEQVVRIDWPDGDEAAGDGRVLSAPKAGRDEAIEELAYLNSYDVIANKDYAYLAYKKTDLKTGKWSVKIKSKSTADSSIDPEKSSLQRQMKAAAAEGKDYVAAGFSLEPKGNDPRLVENRLYFNAELKPSHVEMHLVTRNADGSPSEKQVAKFSWPG